MGPQSIQFRPRSSASAAISSSSSGAARSELLIQGMTCSNCARHASEALQSVEGVSLATVDLARGRATVRWKPEATPHTDQLLTSLAKAGYPSEIAPIPTTPAPSASPTDPSAQPTQDAHDHASAPNPWRRSLAIGIPATVLLLSGDWLLGLGMNHAFHWFAFAVALPVQVLAGAGFYRGAWNQLRNRSANMDTLVSLGSTAAFGFSVWGLFTRAVPHLFFTEAVTILTLISLGHWLEARMATRAGETLRALLELAPHRARKLTPTTTPRSSAFESWTESDVPAGSLVPGDYIALKAGDRVPVDARVVEGQSALDESLLTGESLPVEKAPGSDVLAGTLNTNGRIVARVQATGEGTALAAIVLAVQRAQGSRAAIQRLADQVSSIFVPVVVAIALVAAGAWILAPDTARAVHSWAGSLLWHTHLPESPVATAFYIFCSVLIVACPCAMGIATPVALMAGVNAAARRGILIRDAQALEKSGTVTALVFDKTGTLTEGKPRVVHSGVVSSQTTPDQLAAMAAALARHSQHPLSRAIAPLSSTPVALTGVTEHRGSGLAAHLPANGTASTPSVVRLGSLTWLKDCGVQPAPGTPAMEQAMNEGATVLGLSIDDRFCGWFALRDTLKPQAVQLVQALRNGGSNYQVHLLSGDHPKAVEAVARELGVDGFKAGVRPETKAEEIRSLQQQGLRVGFVGDGINDAPALAQADLGIAVAKATDAARDAADIVLLRSELDGVREALGLAKATLRTIRQNLFWAFFYNAAAVPLAALGLLSPVICALSMGISDVIVIGNALRLAHKKV